jgi:DNA polymerase-4
MAADSVTLCRDCLACFAGGAERCPRCDGPRLVAHPELPTLSIAHVDCDAFYATIEKRDNPALADQPVIVGGSHRGVVSAACYVARTYGIHSAMPMFKALKACPHAVVIPPDMAKYAAVGREVRQLLLSLTPLVEPLSIDEAFLDLSGTERVHGAPPAIVLARFQQRLETEIGVTASVGLSHTKFLAKIASDLDKPRGFAVIGREETLSFLAAQPVSIIWGVGKAMQRRLARDGLRRIADLQRQDERTLAKRYGAMGIRLAKLARGEDERSVIPERKAKSISAETTFSEDYADAASLLPPLRRLSERVSARLKDQGLAGRLVVLKLKGVDFRLRTRNVHLDGHTNLADRIFRAGRDLLQKELDGTQYRLIGIGVGELAATDLTEASDLIDTDFERRAKAEHAMDQIRSRYGDDGLGFGLTFTAKGPRGKPSA